MSRIKKLQDRKSALLKHSREISDRALAENRELTEEEKKATDANLAELGSPGTDGKPATGLHADLRREEELLAFEKSMATTVVDVNAPTAKETAALSGNPLPKEIQLPKVVHRVNALRAFTGDKALERAYASGMFFLATLGNENGKRFCQEHGIELLAAAGNVNTAGGYLIPDLLSSTIIDLREKYGVFRRNTKVMPMASDTMTMPRRVSGLTAYFVSENNAPTESQKVWNNVQLIAKKLAALTRYSTELSEDAIINIADDLAQEIAYAFSLKEDQCGFIGDGTDTYGGIVGATVKITDSSHANGYTTNGGSAGGLQVAAAGGTGFGTVVLKDFENVVGLLPQYAQGNAKWYVSRYGFAASMQRLADAAGGNTNMNIMAGTGPMFLGYPVEISQVLNSTAGSQASKVIALFGDLQMAAVMGERRGISIRSSVDRYFDQDQIGILGTERVDIQVHDMGSTTAAGPLVALQTSAS